MTNPYATNPAARHGGPSADGRRTLLIADDEASVRSALSLQLAGAFRIVAAAKNTSEAIELAEQHRPELALLDVDMPGGGAREAVPQITTRSPTTCMVILSADESRQVVVELLNAGAVAYVRKGVPGSQIVKTLTDALKFKNGHPDA